MYLFIYLFIYLIYLIHYLQSNKIFKILFYFIYSAMTN